MTRNPSAVQISTPASHKTYTLPTVGSIVLARFPHEEDPEPGKTASLPKLRPSLVVGVDKQGGNVTVIYGTTQRVAPEELRPTEFAVYDSDMDYAPTGLSHTTKFNTAREVTLPYTSEFFGVPAPRYGKPHPKDPRLGILPMSYVGALMKAAKNVQK
ncbi:hypothetical protein K9O81_18790 [Leclercia adecarboxylata]|uniref:hypothetical protein n=1 Tax=Leclercia adecarboxylata TaxID=83655 RepID=UPI001CBF2B22|nr:hypothetical protein [Leclercia adecarboxylata]MBZ3802418.1 hypothetical protein [Leclercia adecarboxylata]MBZ3807054.1 hypothetical protein [Leclercia adecarboxylata]